MKIIGAIDFGHETLSKSDEATYIAQHLLAHVLEVEPTYLLAHASELVGNDHLNRYFALLARAERHEPLPYILDSAAFRYLELSVTPAVLIPRPETEQLVDEVLRWAKGRDALTFVDVGTGSGCIAISLATEIKGANVIGIDVSAEALQIAKANAQSNHATVAFHEGSLLNPISAPVDAIIANLPYITDAEMDELPPSVARFEPDLALRGGDDGLDSIRILLEESTTRLKPNGAVFLEIGYRQGESATKLAQSIFPSASVTCKKDYAGQDRFILVMT